MLIRLKYFRAILVLPFMVTVAIPWITTYKTGAMNVGWSLAPPMISGVLCVLLGEAVLFGSMPLFYWFVFFLTVNLIYTPLFEEPSLERRFGEDYILYKKNVPRWIPRLNP